MAQFGTSDVCSMGTCELEGSGIKEMSVEIHYELRRLSWSVPTCNCVSMDRVSTFQVTDFRTDIRTEAPGNWKWAVLSFPVK